jgi:hypothetical protein
MSAGVVKIPVPYHLHGECGGLAEKVNVVAKIEKPNQ